MSKKISNKKHSESANLHRALFGEGEPVSPIAPYVHILIISGISIYNYSASFANKH